MEEITHHVRLEVLADVLFRVSSKGWLILTFFVPNSVLVSSLRVMSALGEVVAVKITSEVEMMVYNISMGYRRREVSGK